jgi:hypothetical protein
MAEAKKKTPKAAEEDLIEGPAEDDAGENMVVALSRGVGAAARSMSDGLQSVADMLRGHSREPPRAKQPAERLEQLLARLKQLVSEAGDDPAALEAQEEFWLLIGKLYQIHRRKRLQRSPDPRVEDKPTRGKRAAGPKATAAAEAAAPGESAPEQKESADAPVAEAKPDETLPSGEKSDEADGDKKKRKK